MRARIAASVVLAASILVGTAGCNLIAPQATQLEYDPSDGVGADVGDVAVRNALLISDGEDSANLIVSMVNTGDTAHRVSVQYDGADGNVTEEITVPANGTVTVGAEGGPTLTLREIDTQPGGLFPVFFQYGEETGTELRVPVLEDALEEYSTLAPTPTPTQSLNLEVGEIIEETPAPTLTPVPTETPEP